MPKLIIHDRALSQEEIAERRLQETLALSPRERIRLALRLMVLAQKFKPNSGNLYSGKPRLIQKGA